MYYPLDVKTLKNVPTIGKGRNVLGVIYMIIREKINSGLLNSLTVDDVKFEEFLNDTIISPTNVISLIPYIYACEKE